MPPKSKAQRRFARAAERGDVAGVSRSAGKKILEGDKAGRRLPARKAKRKQ